MKGLFVCLALFISLVGNAQIADTASLRSFINTHIVTNGNRSITAQKLNDVFNGYLNVWPNDSISVKKGDQYDTLYYYKRGKVTFYTLICGTNIWSTTGNSGLNASENFIGTADNAPLSFRVNNESAGTITSDGGVTSLGSQSGNPIEGAGQFTTSFGYQSLQFNKSSGNSAFGYQALQGNTDGFSNTAMGYYALKGNTTGYNNVAFGMQTLQQNVSGVGNTGIGSFSLGYNSAGSNNTAVGLTALQYSDGNLNTAIGYGAAQYQFGSDSNLSVGAVSGGTLNTGKSNTFIGTNTGQGVVGGSYNTILGANVTGLATSLSNNIIIADGQGHRRINVDNNGNVMFNSITPIAKNTFNGSGAFTDTLTATTMGTADSSNRVATTAWVKNRLVQDIAVTSGLFTPTISATSSNIVSAATNFSRYIRVGNIVYVSGRMTVTTNDTITASLRVSLPITSIFFAMDDCLGSILNYTNPGASYAIVGVPSASAASFTFKNPDTSINSWAFQFTYYVH